MAWVEERNIKMCGIDSHIVNVVLKWTHQAVPSHSKLEKVTTILLNHTLYSFFVTTEFSGFGRSFTFGLRAFTAPPSSYLFYFSLCCKIHVFSKMVIMEEYDGNAICITLNLHFLFIINMAQWERNSFYQCSSNLSFHWDDYYNQQGMTMKYIKKSRNDSVIGNNRIKQNLVTVCTYKCDQIMDFFAMT